MRGWICLEPSNFPHTFKPNILMNLPRYIQYIALWLSPWSPSGSSKTYSFAAIGSKSLATNRKSLQSGKTRQILSLHSLSWGERKRRQRSKWRWIAVFVFLVLVFVILTFVVRWYWIIRAKEWHWHIFKKETLAIKSRSTWSLLI